ncbi:MAG: nucleotidyltransferase family protein, partial [Firmicutes bacterium]|nr:nucleotidyltransferase family protein [Bacillota bacterium]
NIFGAEEGLGSAMKKGVRYWQSYEDIIEDLKSKRYTRTRIARVIAMTLLGVTRQDAKNAQNYIRVLAFDEKGSAYLKQVKKSGECPLPIITNINKDTENCPEILPTLELDILAADIYNLATGRELYENSEFVRKPLKL